MSQATVLAPKSPFSCPDHAVKTGILEERKVNGGSSKLSKKDCSPSVSAASDEVYSPKKEAARIFDLLCALKEELSLPGDLEVLAKNVEFTSEKDMIYFPIPFKETETTAALKGIEALVASALANLKYGEQARKIEINLEHTTCFLFQTYLSTIDGLGKYDAGIKAKLKGEKAPRY
jgi:hypothetical protein